MAWMVRDEGNKNLNDLHCSKTVQDDASKLKANPSLPGHIIYNSPKPS